MTAGTFHGNRAQQRGMTLFGLLFWALVILPQLASDLLLQPGSAAVYPDSPFVIDVTKAPYGARGDGKTDDTEALQRAFNDQVGRHRLIFLPAGTYRVSRTLTWPKKWEGRDNWGHTQLRGEDRDRTIVRLEDRIFTNAAAPQAILWCGGFGSADWFHNYVEDLTFDVGSGNPGATALQFYSNNSGAVRNCRFLAAEGSGAVGLDLDHRDMNGPLLARDCEVEGFRIGIATGHAVNSQTFEHVRLRGQREFGFDNAGQTISIRDLVSENTVPALRTYGTLALVDSQLNGMGKATNVPAVINYNGGRLLLRDLTTRGYRRALGDVATPDFTAALRIRGDDKPGSEGPQIAEYFSHPPTLLVPTETIPGSLHLPVSEPPGMAWDPPAAWADVDSFGADPTGAADSAAAFQKAIDSGATTVFLPGSYSLASTVTIRSPVRRLVGVGGMINYGKSGRPDFRLTDGESPVVTLEHFAHIGGGLEIDTRRTVVLRSVADCSLSFTPRAEGGELFLEDVVTHDLKLRRHRVWARQLNIENEGTHLTNEGGDLWVLGYKTERGGTVLHTLSGGRSEVLGGFSYTTSAGKLAPMFVNEDSRVFAYFAEVCYSGDPFEIVVRETRGQWNKILGRRHGNALPYIGVGRPAP